MEVGRMTAMNLDDPSPILGGKDGQVPLVNLQWVTKDCLAFVFAGVPP